MPHCIIESARAVEHAFFENAALKDIFGCQRVDWQCVLQVCLKETKQNAMIALVIDIPASVICA